MGDVIAFHPIKKDLIQFFEVVGEDDVVVWGGNTAMEAVHWLRNHAGENPRLLVSYWATDTNEAYMVGDPIDITKVVTATLNEWGRE